MNMIVYLVKEEIFGIPINNRRTNKMLYFKEKFFRNKQKQENGKHYILNYMLISKVCIYI